MFTLLMLFSPAFPLREIGLWKKLPLKVSATGVIMTANAHSSAKEIRRYNEAWRIFGRPVREQCPKPRSMVRPGSPDFQQTNGLLVQKSILHTWATLTKLVKGQDVEVQASYHP